MEPRTFCDALNREAGDYLLATVLEGAAQGRSCCCAAVCPSGRNIRRRVWKHSCLRCSR